MELGVLCCFIGMLAYECSQTLQYTHVVCVVHIYILVISIFISIVFNLNLWLNDKVNKKVKKCVQVELDSRLYQHC